MVVHVNVEPAAIGVHAHQHRLLLALPADDDLLVQQSLVFIAALAQGLAVQLDGAEPPNELGQLVLHRLLKAGAQAGVAILLVAIRAPLAAIVQAGDARHAVEHGIEPRQVVLVPQNGVDAGHIVVIRKAQQMLPPVEAPVLAAELPVKGMGNLKHILVVKGGVKPLVALIIGDAVQHVRVHNPPVVPVDHLAQQEEAWVPALAELVQPPQKVLVQQVGHVQPQAINGKLIHPARHAFQNMVHHRRVLQVQLHQLKMALPALVPQAIVVVGVAPKVNVEPVLVGGAFPVAEHILKSPEAPAHMVEDSVQHHPDAGLMQGIAHTGKILVRAQAGVNFLVVPGVVAMGVRLEHRGEVHRAGVQLFQMLHPVQHFQNAALGLPVVLKGRAAKAHRINLVEHGGILPARLVFQADHLLFAHDCSSFRLFLSVRGGSPAGRRA